MILQAGKEFDRITDVMNDVFGKNYKSCFRGRYAVDPSKTVYAWFPKIADLKNGKPEPGDREYGWCNTLSDGGKYLYMNNYADPDRLNKEPAEKPEPHITFAKLPGEKQYRYIGVYVRRRRDPEQGWIYERIAEDIDLKDYIL